jgi:hypothetical protein
MPLADNSSLIIDLISKLEKRFKLFIENGARIIIFEKITETNNHKNLSELSINDYDFRQSNKNLF